ncbi:MAG: hypothetical protein HKP55_05260 [Gammaproteobacteria bacterium]|nr:hypothetical protein [Gammaproteobacteria bacterium]NNJ91063.1 hypothetical protein [Gammaproteobacteria bacterium]
MPMYIFTYNQQDNSFPERYRVVLPEDDAEFLRETESLTGTILKAEAIDFLDEMLARYQSQESIITEMVDAPHWKFIEQRFNPAKATDNAKPRFI